MAEAIVLPLRVARTAISKLERARGAWRARARFAAACGHGPLLQRARREVLQLDRLVRHLREACNA